MKLYDTAIVGAGMAGLTCARQLQQRGYKVVILEKSRGVGGRVTTRRVGDTVTIDRGLPWLEVQGEHTQKLIEQLQDEEIIELWRGRVSDRDCQGNIQSSETKNRYVAPQGINAIAKYLARNLTIEKQCRITSVQPTADRTWQLAAENERVLAKAVVIAIPAPQAVEILQQSQISLPVEFINQLRRVKYFPCITVSTGYDSRASSNLPSWDVLNLNGDENLTKIIFDSSKKNIASQPVVIFHSTPQFAQNYLEVTDLQPAGKRLLEEASLIQPWFELTEWMQVHRWRYAIVSNCLENGCLATSSPLPLVCCGDWCGGNNLESALVSGMASAEAISNLVST